MNFAQGSLSGPERPGPCRVSDTAKPQGGTGTLAKPAEAFDGVEQAGDVQITVDLHVLRDGEGDVGPDALGVPEGRHCVMEA